MTWPCQVEPQHWTHVYPNASVFALLAKELVTYISICKLHGLCIHTSMVMTLLMTMMMMAMTSTMM